MLVLQGPRVWALLLIFLGFVFAYPFLKREQDGPAVDSLDGSPFPAQNPSYASSEGPVNSPASHASVGVLGQKVFDGIGAPAPLPSTDRSSSKLVSSKPISAGQNQAEEDALRNLASGMLHSEGAMSGVNESERFRDIPSEQLAEEPLPHQSQFTYDKIKSLPSWAQRQSRMDALVNKGVKSQASEPIRQPLKEMSTWTNMRAEPKNLSTKDAAGSNRDGTEPKRQIREVFALRSSPFTSGQVEERDDEREDEHLDRKLPRRTVNRSWDLALSKLDPNLLAQSSPENVSSTGDGFQADITSGTGLPSPEQIASTNGTGIKRIGATLRPTSRTSIRPTKGPGNLVVGASLSSTPAPPGYYSGTREKQVADRKRHFVYQPGHLPDD